MALFTDTITIFNGLGAGKVVSGVQWSEKSDRSVSDKKIAVVKYISITFPEGTYENIPFDLYDENTCIAYGEVQDVVTEERGSRIFDLLKKYKKSGRIQSINDNTNRSYLKNVKVVVS